MPFPEAILEQARRPEFWSQFFFETWGEEFPDLKDCRLEFPVGSGRALVLAFGTSLDCFGLYLASPGRDPVQIAWDDQAHWHPHVLRWEELDLVCRAVALGDPTLPHPGLPLVLLHRFTPICVGDRPEVIHPLIAEAYRAVGAFSEAQVTESLYHYDRRQDSFVWRHNFRPNVWCPEQTDEDATAELYSLRQRGNAEFPFKELNKLFDAARDTRRAAVDSTWLAGEAGALARAVASRGDASGFGPLADALEEAGCGRAVFLDGLRATEFPVRGCWIVETLLGLEPGAVIARALGHTRRPDRVRYVFEIDVPAGPANEQQNADRVDRLLDKALRDAGLGNADSYSSSYAGTPPQLTDYRVTATVHDDRDRGLALIRDVLTRAKVPPHVVIELESPERASYPLVPGDPV